MEIETSYIGDDFARNVCHVRVNHNNQTFMFEWDLNPIVDESLRLRLLSYKIKKRVNMYFGLPINP